MAKRGRPKGSRGKGYFFRKGRGWCATDKTPLLDERGQPIRDKSASKQTLADAYARYRLNLRIPERTDDTMVRDACNLYLSHCRATQAESTYNGRTGALFDFCTGFPARKRQKPRQEKDRIHQGYGDMPVARLLSLHVDQWLAAHPTWNGARRTKVQALKRALNYCVESGVITANPIKGYKVGKANIRKTYLTPEQEKACYEHANDALATAIKVCIRTGARYGCEFAQLTARHVEDGGNGRMTWRFPPEESKTGKERIIRITDQRIIKIVRRQINEFPEGPIFRNTRGTPWKQEHLGAAFTRLKERLARKGIKLDDDACMYSTRHTYAKRTLQGYWTGQPTNIETLSLLMGNSRDVCWEHYAEWCDTYADPLWRSA